MKTNNNKQETVLIYAIVAFIAIGVTLAGLFSNNLSAF
jgi:hypothetical protein